MAYTTINKSSDHFTTHLYSGNDSTNNQTSLGLTPDLVWVKCRNNATPSHYWVDKVRGDKKYISSNATTAEQTDSNTFDLVSGGFNLAGGNGWTNLSGRNYVAWNWKANGQGSSNTDGTINTTYTSASTTSGFSISTWTGTGSNGTIGHGLGAVPKMLIIKSTSNTQAWMVYHVGPGNNSEGQITNGAFSASSTAWQDTDPTNQVFYVSGSAGDSVNASGYTYVGYAFAEVKGFSKIGSYTGNGNADGTFVYTGFKPSWVMIKRYDSGTLDWNMYDNKRLGYNGGDAPLFANLSNAESNDYGRIDLVSNGFKIRTSNDQLANNGGSFLYMAFAEAPLVGSNNVPCTAR
jgi:hypothetical protein